MGVGDPTGGEAVVLERASGGVGTGAGPDSERSWRCAGAPGAAKQAGLGSWRSEAHWRGTPRAAPAATVFLTPAGPGARTQAPAHCSHRGNDVSTGHPPWCRWKSRAGGSLQDNHWWPLSLCQPCSGTWLGEARLAVLPAHVWLSCSSLPPGVFAACPGGLLSSSTTLEAQVARMQLLGVTPAQPSPHAPVAGRGSRSSASPGWPEHSLPALVADTVLVFCQVVDTWRPHAWASVGGRLSGTALLLPGVGHSLPGLTPSRRVQRSQGRGSGQQQHSLGLGGLLAGRLAGTAVGSFPT